MSLRLSLGLAFVVLTGACTEPASLDGPTVTSGVARLELPLARNYNIDLLFVIDNSPGITPQRAKLLDNDRRFMEVLEAFPGGLPDLHIGVVTTDVGTRGPWDAGPGPSIGTGDGSCTSDGDRGDLRRVTSIEGNFLSDIAHPDGTRERNYTGSLADAFVQLADVGAAGCTYARPLEAMRRALVDKPANAGFFRDNAALAVVLLTNDDDCSFGSSSFTGGQLDRSRCMADAGSLVALGEYVALLKASKSDPSRVFVFGGFARPGSPACADARPAARLDAFLDAFPNRARAVSICESDLGELLVPLTQAIKTTLGLPCFDRPLLDVDPVADGLQVDCASWYSYRDRGAPVEEVVPACRGDSPGPCWQLHQDPLACPGETVEFRDPRRGFGVDSDARAFIECVSW